MLKKYLVFRLHGPLASWGDIAVGEYRPSYSYPSKSAICGIVAAALGIERARDEEHQKLAHNLEFAVAVRALGKLLRDYHTIQTPSGEDIFPSRAAQIQEGKLNTILSTRDYRMDAVYDVCLSQRESFEPTLEQIREALLQPQFTLYLGRKSCVAALPFYPLVLEDSSAIAALKAYHDKWREAWRQKKLEKEVLNYLPREVYTEENWSVIYLWEEASKNQPMQVHMRRDMVLSRKRWQFQRREENMLVEEG